MWGEDAAVFGECWLEVYSRRESYAVGDFYGLKIIKRAAGFPMLY